MTEQQQQTIFKEWLHKHQALLFKIVRAYAVTPMDQQDLFQEIAIQVWRSIPSFRNESAVSTWLYRIALNMAIRWVSRENKHRNADLETIPELLSPAIVVDERLHWLYKAIHQLHAIDRSLILLLLDGFSYKEMAVITGISESNVGVKINRIKKQLVILSQKYQDHGV